MPATDIDASNDAASKGDDASKGVDDDASKDVASDNEIEDDEGLEDDGYFAPEFTRKPKSVTVEENSTVAFSFQIEAEPLPQIQWEKDGRALTIGDRFKVRCNAKCAPC